ncbi:MAG: hypothetical protein RQ833_11855 [Sphingomonadaceae bacterium]|nr:hypothetical protein [Sphingomonadaceae bacterium]
MRGTGVGAGQGAGAPVAAVQALHRFYEASIRPPAEAAAEIRVARLLDDYLIEHAAKQAAGERTAICVAHWLGFLSAERKAGRVDSGGATVDDLTPETIQRFIDRRLREGVGGNTISRDIAALRGAIRHAWKRRRLKDPPFIAEPDAELMVRSRDIELSLDQIAGVFEAAVSTRERFHVADFVFAHLASHARSEAILECELDVQYDRARGTIAWNAPGRRQTRKFRSITRVGPSFAARLAKRQGRLILCRGLIADRRWTTPGVPEYWEKPVADIGRAWGSVLIAAHEREPRLGLALPVLGDDGRQRFEPMRDARRRVVGERLLWTPVAPPNVMRHTIHTYLEAAGVPTAQIDSMSGHNRVTGSGRSYTHLRPEYQRDALAAIEAYFELLDGMTSAHRRIQFASSGATVLPLRAGTNG